MKEVPILVTGATGFIGRHLVEKLFRDGLSGQIKCLVLDSESPREREGRSLLRRLGMEYQKVDLLSPLGPGAIPQDTSILVHLAANTRSELGDHRCNDLGTRHLLDALGPLKRNIHLIFMSSLAVFDGRKECHRPIMDSDVPTNIPTARYSLSKYRAEMMLRDACMREGLRLTILRPGTVFGRGVRPGGVFGWLERNRRRHSLLSRVQWPGLIGLVHVGDVVDILVKLIRLPPPPEGVPHIYNIVGQNLTLFDLCRMSYQFHGEGFRPISLPSPIIGLLKFIGRQRSWTGPILPEHLYIRLWQADLVLNHYTWAVPDGLCRIFPLWQPRLLEDSLAEIEIARED